MIIKTEAQLKEDVAEEISRSILEQLIEETLDETLRRSRQSTTSPKPTAEVGRPSSVDVLQLVNDKLFPAGSRAARPSQMYMTTTFDIFSSDESDDEEEEEQKREDKDQEEEEEEEVESGSPEGSLSTSRDPVDASSAEEHSFTGSKLGQIEVRLHSITDWIIIKLNS